MLSINSNYSKSLIRRQRCFYCRVTEQLFSLPSDSIFARHSLKHLLCARHSGSSEGSKGQKTHSKELLGFLSGKPGGFPWR